MRPQSPSACLRCWLLAASSLWVGTWAVASLASPTSAAAAVAVADPAAPASLTASTSAPSSTALASRGTTATPVAMDINHASEADLDSLVGVGPALTARLLAQRAVAPFADWADLVRRVKGIRQATAHRLAEQGLTVNGQTLQAQRPPASAPTEPPASQPALTPPASAR